MKTIASFLILIIFISCKQNEIDSNTTNWDFTKIKFNNNSLNFIGSDYNSFTVTKNSDSTLILNCGFFQGWKKKSILTTDTLKLREKYFVIDSLKKTSKQILSYSIQNKIFFQLVVTKKNSTLNNIKEDDDNSFIPKDNFEYKAKLFVQKDNINYFDENLWYK